MLSGLSQQVTLAAIEAARGRAWMLHAAGIATPDGQVVVLVGPSGRGKTTASRALGAVYGYVSDETIAIDDDGRVWPYRKPLSVIEDPAAPKTQLPPSALGLQPLPDAELRVAAVVLLDRDPSHPEAPTVEVTDRRRRARGAGLADELPARPAGRAAVHRRARGRDRRHPHGEVPRGGDAALGDSRARAPGRRRSRCRRSPRTSAPRADPRTAGPRFSRVEVADEVAIDDPDRIAILTIRENRQGHVTAARRDRPGGVAGGRRRDAAAS